MKRNSTSSKARSEIDRSNEGAPEETGRKQQPLTVAPRRRPEERTEDSLYAYDFFASAMRSPNLPFKDRVTAAREVLDRNTDKPGQRADPMNKNMNGDDDISRLSPDQRRQRIAELLDLRNRNQPAPAPRSRGKRSGKKPSH